MTTERMIDYEVLAQDAMRGVVRTILMRVAKSGLPGDHHFYISFDTLAPGVIISKRLREKYSEEMTVVLQHRFWDLAVNEDRFEVKLTFDGIPERLVVPFKAIKVFFDPSVRYGLQFEAPDLDADDGPGAAGERSMRLRDGGDAPAPGVNGAASSTTHVRTSRTAGERKQRLQRKQRAERDAETPDAPAAGAVSAAPTPAPSPAARRCSQANAEAMIGGPRSI